MAKAEKPNILISGYYGFGNAGDDAVLEAMVTSICAEIPDSSISVLAKIPPLFPLPHNVTAIQRSGIKEVVRAVALADIVVSGGGGLIQDVTSVKSLSYYLGILFMAHIMGKKTMVFSQGVGPLKHLFSRLLTKFVLDRVSCITVRDEKGKSFLDKLKVRTPVTVTADPVFLLLPPEEEEIQSVRQNLGLPLNAGREVLLVVRDWPGIGDCLNLLAKAVISWSKESSFPGHIVIVPFQHSLDLSHSEELARQLSPKIPVTLIREQLSSRQFLAVISHASFVVSMRLHALIFAAITHTPFIGLSYDPKVASLAKNFNQPFVELDSMTHSVLLTLLNETWKNLEENKKQIANIISTYRSWAKEAVRMLGELWRS